MFQVCSCLYQGGGEDEGDDCQGTAEGGREGGRDRPEASYHRWVPVAR